MKKHLLITLFIVATGLQADVTDAGLNIEGNTDQVSTNVNASMITKDKSPSTYNFKMDH